MGRINTIYDPINWKIDLEGKSKILEDYYYYEISELISKYNYDNIFTKKKENTICVELTEVKKETIFEKIKNLFKKLIK